MKDGGMGGNSDDRLDERLKKAAAQYNEPPETPREAMWSRILAARAERRVTRMPVSRGFWRSRWMWVPAAAAAVLVIGIAIGRFTATVGPDDVAQTGQPGQVSPESGHDTPAGATGPERGTTAQPGSPARGTAYQLAAAPVLNQAELLLTQFRTGEAMDENGDSYRKRAKALLSDTRYLLASPAADDPQMRRLLSDLELVLTQIVRLAGDDEGDEKEFITDDMKNRSLLPRLRANVPMGTFSSTI